MTDHTKRPTRALSARGQAIVDSALSNARAIIARDAVNGLQPYHYPAVFEQFMGYAKDHELTVLHDEGLYRHLRFSTAGGYVGGFDLITWPGHLMICGDLGDGWSFARVPDMLAWFNDGTAKHGRINPGYWWQKMPEAQRNAAKGYSDEKFRAYVAELVKEEAERLELTPDALAALVDDVEREVLENAYDEHEAIAALSDYTHGFGLPDGEYARLTHDLDPGSWTDFDHHFLLACHAIHYGAGLYARKYRAKRLGGAS